MKKICLIILIYLLTINAAYADLNYGMTAYQNSDYNTAYKELLPFAKKGDMHAQYLLAEMYYHGNGVAKDYKTAFSWYQKASTQNHHPSQSMLGYMYKNGIGAKKNIKEAIRWLIESRDTVSMYSLGNIYATDKTYKNLKEAVRWYKESAEHGHASAQGNLGSMYWNGDGTLEDRIEAYKWIILAVSNGSDFHRENKTNLEKRLTSLEMQEGLERAKKWQAEFEAKNNLSTPSAKNDKNIDISKVTWDWVDTDDLTPIINSSKQENINNKKWLIVIAVEVYDKTLPVIYSYISANAFAKIAQKKLGVPEQNSYLLIGDAATTGAIKDTIAKLADNVKDGDTIYFYYSGHGIPDPASKESFILPKDKAVEYVAKEQELKLSNIYTTLQNSKASKIIAVIDACFSGTTDGKSVYKGVAAAHFKPKSFSANPNGKLAILAAGKDNQFSNSYDEKGHRLFSYFVIKSLLNGRKNVGDIYKDIVLKVKDESRRKGGDTYEQEPQLNGNGKLEL